MPRFRSRSTASSAPTFASSKKKGETDLEAHDKEAQLVPVEEGDEGVVEDEVFGLQGGNDTVNFRETGWISMSVMMMKSHIGVGVLSIPYAFQTLGLVPGILALITIASLTLYCNLQMAAFKRNHPEVYSLSDAARLMFGQIGYEGFSVMYWLCCVTSTSSALITMSTALNALSLHGACTAVFVGVSAIALYPLASLRKLDNIAYISWFCLACIVAALLLLIISLAIGQRPALAPQTGPIDLQVHMFGTPTLPAAANSCANLFFAFTANIGYISYASEMKRPQDLRKAIWVSQPAVLVIFLVVGIVTYMEAGQYVASPALGSAGPLIKRIAYGLALPAAAFTGFLYIHLAAKQMFIRILRGTEDLNHGTKKHWVVWLSSTLFCLVIAYLVCSAIPVFSGLVGLIAALVNAPLSLHLPGLMYLYDHRGFFKSKEYRTTRVWFGVAFVAVLLAAATFLLITGTWGSIADIITSYANGVSKPFGCADNSGSV